MHILLLGIKELSKKNIAQITLIVFLLVSVLDPLSVALQNIMLDGALLEGPGAPGKNPFQFWLLMNSVSWGHQVYHTLLWIIPVLLTGMVFFQEQKSAMLTCQIVRMGRRDYFSSKIIATGVFSFVSILVILSASLLVTCLVFRDWGVHSTYYEGILPQVGTFADALYQVSPLCMMFGYTVLNAAALALLALFALAVQMVFRFPNIYVAIIVPVVILYLVSFGMEASPALHHYSMRFLLQPMAATALEATLTPQDLAITFGGWAAVDAGLLFLGVRRHQEVV